MIMDKEKIYRPKDTLDVFANKRILKTPRAAGRLPQLNKVLKLRGKNVQRVAIDA